MASRRVKIGPKGLLSLCQEVDQLAERLRAPGERRPERLETRRRTAVQRLRGAIHRPARDGFRRALRDVQAKFGLSDAETMLLLILFNRRVTRAAATASGRDILQAAARRDRDVIEGARLLHPGARLIESGLVSSTALAPEDVFDAEFRIAPETFQRLYRAFHALEPAPAEFAIPGYTSAVEHLLDLRLLVDVARRRAARVFPESGWADSGSQDDLPMAALVDQYERVRSAIRARELMTPENVRLPIRDFRNERKLAGIEELVIVALLVSELFSSRSTIELGELLRLASASELDLLANRGLISEAGRLRAEGLISVEGDVEGKELGASAWLPEWITERLLDGVALPKRGIEPETRAEFHRYLDGLRDSEDFYRRL